MSDIETGIETTCETTEQALARVEAECGWSDALLRLLEALGEPGAAAAPDAVG